MLATTKIINRNFLTFAVCAGTVAARGVVGWLVGLVWFGWLAINEITTSNGA